MDYTLECKFLPILIYECHVSIWHKSKIWTTQPNQMRVPRQRHTHILKLFMRHNQFDYGENLEVMDEMFIPWMGRGFFFLKEVFWK